MASRKKLPWHLDFEKSGKKNKRGKDKEQETSRRGLRLKERKIVPDSEKKVMVEEGKKKARGNSILGRVEKMDRSYVGELKGGRHRKKKAQEVGVPGKCSADPGRGREES